MVFFSLTFLMGESIRLTGWAVVVAGQHGLRVGAQAVPVVVCAAVDSGAGRCQAVCDDAVFVHGLLVWPYPVVWLITIGGRDLILRVNGSAASGLVDAGGGRG